MATLTETATSTRKAIKIGGLLIIVFLFFKFSLFVYTNFIKVIKPPPAQPPTVSFGKLPTIEFPEKLHPELTLRLETPSGGTPDLGDRASVYLMPTFRSSFMALGQAKELAAKINFTKDPKEITERRYRWETDEFLPSTLEMDIIDGSFILKRNWQSDPTILSEKQLPGKEQVEIETKNFLRQIELLSDGIRKARVEVTYLTFSAGQYTKAISLSEADFVQADLYRPDINDQLVMPQDPNKGVVRIIFSGSREAEKRIVQAEYNYFPVNLNQLATYPIKTASQAWRELQTRQGYIASIGENISEVIAIRKIYLGYFDGESSSGFLQPIIVFEGDNDFFGYVQAITNEWLEKPLTTGGL
ncbi:MAG: hypothetical protein ABIJ43_04675 [Candidatus Beckwithbacteria bacterium]|nr:hypothetical protein [Patescibacteria group bacterium]